MAVEMTTEHLLVSLWTQKQKLNMKNFTKVGFIAGLLQWIAVY